jgi:hypothetical protein
VVSAIRTFARDPHRVFPGIQALAFVRNELLLDVGVGILRSADSRGVCRELGIAIFTNTKHGNIIFSFDDPEFALRNSGADGCCSGSMARRSLMVDFNSVQNGLDRYEKHRSAFRLREKVKACFWRQRAALSSA